MVAEPKLLTNSSTGDFWKTLDTNGISLNSEELLNLIGLLWSVRHTCKGTQRDAVPSMLSNYQNCFEDDYSVELSDYERLPDEDSSSAAHLRLHLSFRRFGDKQINYENALKETSKEENPSITQIQDKFQETSLTTKEQLEDIHCSSTNGTLVWRITNVAGKLADARSERQTSIYSPLFYTSPTGYKMRARIDINGFENARATHMSVFLVLLKGDYDAVLKWPFTLLVTFCLYDQTGAARHVIDTYYPSTGSLDVTRPDSRISIGYGIPKYCPLGILEGSNSSYIRDDTIFLGVTVHFDTQTKVSLPYTIADDIALPRHIQDSIHAKNLEEINRIQGELQREIERNDQEILVRCLINSSDN